MKTKEMCFWQVFTAIVFAIVTVTAVPVSGYAVDQTIEISPDDAGPDFFNQWVLTADVSPSQTVGSGGLVVGPDTPPLGVGSVNLNTDLLTDNFLITTSFSTALRFDTLTAFEYSSYVDVASGTASGQAVSFSIFVDYDTTDVSSSFQGSIVFEPLNQLALQGPVVKGVWQSWDMLAGRWWATGAPGNVSFPQRNLSHKKECI